jgi:hypothetical protein
MRTKTLLLSAALVAAGVCSSLAQVYSVNAVGYVNLTVPPGYSIIANPLSATDNTLGAVLTTATGTPYGTQVYLYNGTGFTSALYDDADQIWTSNGQPATTLPMAPGVGFFIRNNGTAFTNTFVGEVLQGPLSVPLPSGLSIVSSKVPQAGKISTDLRFPLIAGTQVYLYNGTGYDSYLYDDVDGWVKNSVPNEPTINIAQGFWVRNNGAAASWDRVFSVNTNP